MINESSFAVGVITPEERKRQCVLLCEELSPQEWPEPLELEVRAKARPIQDPNKPLSLP